MARETSFWNWLREIVSSLGHFTRIESEISPGVPDVYFALTGWDNYEGWIELKSVKEPKRMSSRPLKRKGLRDDQIEWIDKHFRAGVRVHIFVKLGGDIYCFFGCHARQLNGYTFGQIQAHADYIVPQRRDKTWTRLEFLKHLTRSHADHLCSSHSKLTTSQKMASMTRSLPPISRPRKLGMKRRPS